MKMWLEIDHRIGTLLYEIAILPILQLVRRIPRCATGALFSNRAE